MKTIIELCRNQYNIIFDIWQHYHIQFCIDQIYFTFLQYIDLTENGFIDLSKIDNLIWNICIDIFCIRFVIFLNLYVPSKMFSWRELLIKFSHATDTFLTFYSSITRKDFLSRINPHLFLQHVVKTLLNQYAPLMCSSY